MVTIIAMVMTLMAANSAVGVKGKSCTTVYKNGVESKTCEHFYPNGKTKYSISFRNGKMHGSSKIYSSNGTLRWNAQYVNDKIHGVELGWHPDGSFCCKIPYENGEIHGIIEVFYFDKLSRTNSFRRGIRHGPDVTYRPDGAIESKQFFFNGLMVTESEFIRLEFHGVD